MCSLEQLTVLMEQCQRDTQEICGAGAAGRLGNWERHRATKDDLVRFIERCITSGDGWENGRCLEENQRVSLESIVLDKCPECFFEIAKRTARQTLERV